MRVIEEKPFEYEFTCRCCHSQLAAEAEDVVTGRFGSMGDYSREYYVTCPVCTTIKFIEFAALTPKVQSMADHKEKRDKEKGK